MQITHATLIRNLRQITCGAFESQTKTELNESQRVLLPISVQHIFGLYSVYYALLRGFSLFATPRFTIRSVAAAVDRLKITRLHLSTAMIQVLAGGVGGGGSGSGVNSFSQLPDGQSPPPQPPLFTIKSVTVGGARVDEDFARRFVDKFMVEEFRQSEFLVKNSIHFFAKFSVHHDGNRLRLHVLAFIG